MKKLLFLTLLLTSFGSHALCPSGTVSVLNCKSTPVKGDNEMVSQIADSISICQKNNQVQLVLTAEGTSSAGKAVFTKTTGATVFELITDDQSPAPFSFSVGNRPFPGGVKMAKLSARWFNEITSSTFTCRDFNNDSAMLASCTGYSSRTSAY